ncbi:unnamed protein product, partial [Nesidiocoris tenuis]
MAQFWPEKRTRSPKVDVRLSYDDELSKGPTGKRCARCNCLAHALVTATRRIQSLSQRGTVLIWIPGRSRCATLSPTWDSGLRAGPKLGRVRHLCGMVHSGYQRLKSSQVLF